MDRAFFKNPNQNWQADFFCWKGRVYGFEVGVELNTRGDSKDQALLCGWLQRLEIQHVLVDFCQKHTSFVKKIRSKIGSKTSQNLDSKYILRFGFSLRSREVNSRMTTSTCEMVWGFAKRNLPGCHYYQEGGQPNITAPSRKTGKPGDQGARQKTRELEAIGG